MAAPVSAEFVNAIVQSVLDLLRAAGEGEVRVGKPVLVSNVPGAPCVSVSVEVRGPVNGPIYWAFDAAVAEALVRAIFPMLPDGIPQADAVGELGNIILGNATGALQDAGYPVEILTPQLVDESGPGGGALPRRTIQVPVRTRNGEVRVLIGVEPLRLVAA
jgi:chemotaxis protein CheX